MSGQFVLNGVQINAVAEVCSSRVTVGMGLQWCDLGWDGQEKLNNLLHSFALNNTEANSAKAEGAGTVGQDCINWWWHCGNGWRATMRWWTCR